MSEDIEMARARNKKRQNLAHEISELARRINKDESDQIIKLTRRMLMQVAEATRKGLLREDRDIVYLG